MSESLIFELKLQIQHLEEKVTFLAGGTNGRELAEVVMEKDEEIEQSSRKIKSHEMRILQLAEGAKRVDAKRRELLRLSERQGVRLEALEKEVDNQLEAADNLRAQVTEGKEALREKEVKLKSLEAELEASKKQGAQSLSVAQAEAVNLHTIIERQRVQLVSLEDTKRGLEQRVSKMDLEIGQLEERRKSTAQRSRDMKHDLQELLALSHQREADLAGEKESLTEEGTNLRKRQEENALQILEQERKMTMLARENGSLRTKHETVKKELESMAIQVEAMTKDKEKADALLIERDSDNINLQAKNDSLRHELDRKLHKANQDVQAAKKKLEDAERANKLKIEQLERQMSQVEEDNANIEKSQGDRIEVLGKQLEEAKEKTREVNAYLASLKEEVTGRGRKAETALQGEMIRRAKAEKRLGEASVELQQLRGEVDRFRHLGTEVSRLKGENKNLNEKIQRQESFMKKKLKEDKQKEKRTARPGGGVYTSGRGSLNVVSSTPSPSSGNSTSPGLAIYSDPVSGHSPNPAGPSPRNGKGSGSSSSIGSGAGLPPTRRGHSHVESASGVLGGKENNCSERFGTPTGLGWSQQPCKGGDSGGGGAHFGRSFCTPQGTGTGTGTGVSSSTGLSGSMGLKEGRGRKRTGSGGNRVESRTVHSLSRERKLGETALSQHGSLSSRGRQTAPAKVGAPRSSSVGLQSRAATGWR